MLTILYGQTRIMFAMCRDGLLPRELRARSTRAQTPARITGDVRHAHRRSSPRFVPLSEIAKLVNIGTLFAFLIVNIGVIVLRRTQPDLERGFRVPFVPVFPIIGVAAVHLPDDKLELVTWYRFFGWLSSGSSSTSSTAARTRACSAARARTRSAPRSPCEPRAGGPARV